MSTSDPLEEERRAETTIKLRVGKNYLFLFSPRMSVSLLTTVEAKNLPPAHELRQSRDTYIVIGLDQEEIFRTATVEKSLW